MKWADYVFISAMIVQRESARTIVNHCKAIGVKVVAGGPLFTMEHEQFPDVDHFVLNEAEETLKPFLPDLAQGRARRVYSSEDFPGIHWVFAASSASTIGGSFSGLCSVARGYSLWRSRSQFMVSTSARRSNSM